VFPYWLLFSVFALGAMNQGTATARPRSSGPLLVFASLFMALMIGLRYQVGGDWFSYQNTFLQLSYQDLAGALQFGDPAYMALNWLASQVGLEIWAVNLVCGIICAWGLTSFARTQPYPWLVMVVAVPYFVIVVGMGYTRQAVAISLLLVAIVRFLDGRLISMLLFTAVAVTFHKTAVLGLALIAISGSRNRFVVAGAGLAGAVLLYFLFLDEAVDNLVKNYERAGYASEGAGVRVAMNVVPAIAFLLFRVKFSPPGTERRLWTNFSLAALASALGLYFLESSTAVDRLALFLTPLQLYVLARAPLAFSRNGQPSRGMLLLVILYSFLVQVVWLVWARHSEYWLPYQIYPLTGS
jgi:hypothetical protein